MEKIAKIVEEVTGINVKNVGRKQVREITLAKHAFYRACSLRGYQFREIVGYCGDSSFSTACHGRRNHIKKCKEDPFVEIQWTKIKKLLKDA